MKSDMSKHEILLQIPNYNYYKEKYAQNNEYNLNKLYISIQELTRAVEADSRELVRSKYLLLIEEI